MADSGFPSTGPRLVSVCLLVAAILSAIPSAASSDAGPAYIHLNESMDAYESVASNEPRFLASYTGVSKIPSDQALEDVAYVYDNALALLCYVYQNTADSRRRARILADSLVYAMSHDRHYTDGRLRNAYAARQLIHKDTGRANLPGFWNPDTRQWQEDGEQASTHTGNMAWASIALSQYFNAQGGEAYKAASAAIGNWIETNAFSADGGYTGGYAGWEPDAEKLLWKSTEHNLDVYACFVWLHIITGDRAFLQRALHARRFVESMWAGDHFWIGTKPQANLADTDHPALDIQAWAVLAFESYIPALRWAEQFCYTEADGFRGFDYNTDKDGVWFEGTAQMALAYRVAGENDKAVLYSEELKKAQSTARNHNGKGMPAASRDHVSTGLGTDYFNRLHIGATAWYIFADLGINPFSGKRYR
jgi:hypothetical protein